MTKLPDTEREWHLDKRVPIALIIALVGQTFLIGWWTSSIDGRVSALEKNNPSDQLTNIAVDVAVLKENVKTTKDDIASMKSGFDGVLQLLLQEKNKR